MEPTAMSDKSTPSLSPSGSERRRSSGANKATVLIEKDGKTVSKTSQGKRRFHNKSKLGCDMCKRRRVKCDEGKPVCTKCSNMGLDCHYSVLAAPGSVSGSDHGSDAKVKQEARKEQKVPSSAAQAQAHVRARSQTQAQAQAQAQAPPMPKTPTLDLSSLAQLAAAGGFSTKFINAAKAQMSQAQLAQAQHFISQIPSFSFKSPPSGGIDPQSFTRDYSTDASPNDLNNLSINMINDNNPTISPQPTMSPGSTHSHISMNHHHQHQRSQQGTQLPPPPPMASAAAHDFNAQMSSLSSSYTPSTTGLNVVDLKLMYHYTKTVAPTITTAGISEEKIWSDDIPQLAFDYSFLMHSILAFSATHLSRTEKNMEQYVTYHRGEALRLLREAVLEISPENTDALVASALILIMDSLANASLPSASSATSLPASAWIFHVKGAATILTAVWPLPQTSRFYTFISVDLSDLGDIINDKTGHISDLVCFDESIADLYPVEYDSPYLITLAYLDKLHKEKYKSDFILRIFAFPALLDKTFLALLMSGDLSAMRIMRSYYTLLRGFTTEMKDKVWFLEGVSKVLPADVDDYSGGGGMHMMLDFLGGGLPSMATSSMGGLNIDINDHFMNP